MHYFSWQGAHHIQEYLTCTIAMMCRKYCACTVGVTYKRQCWLGDDILYHQYINIVTIWWCCCGRAKGKHLESRKQKYMGEDWTYNMYSVSTVRSIWCGARKIIVGYRWRLLYATGCSPARTVLWVCTYVMHSTVQEWALLCVAISAFRAHEYSEFSLVDTYVHAHEKFIEEVEHDA